MTESGDAWCLGHGDVVEAAVAVVVVISARHRRWNLTQQQAAATEVKIEIE